MRIESNKDTNCKFIVGAIAIMALAFVLNWEACKSGRAGKLLDNLATPYSGEAEALPKEVQFLLKFLRANRVESISVSQLIAKNRFVAQPLTEGAYPVIVEDSAKIFVSYSAEALPSNCVTLKVERGIRIASRR